MALQFVAPWCCSAPGGLAQQAELAGRQDSAATAIPTGLLASPVMIQPVECFPQPPSHLLQARPTAQTEALGDGGLNSPICFLRRRLWRGHSFATAIMVKVTAGHRTNNLTLTNSWETKSSVQPQLWLESSSHHVALHLAACEPHLSHTKPSGGASTSPPSPAWPHVGSCWINPGRNVGFLSERRSSGLRRCCLVGCTPTGKKYYFR